MIEATQSEWMRKACYQVESKLVFPLRFKKIEIQEVPIRADHSILLLQNHLSWWDGFWGNYLNYQYLYRKYHVMVQEDQILKNPLLKHLGAFSVRKNSREALQSIEYARQLLRDPNNTVLIFPQGRLQSMHVREITIEKGVLRLIDQLEGKCQVIYNAVTIDYLESFKPRVRFNLYDCGSADQINTTELQTQISQYHQQALENMVRK